MKKYLVFGTVAILSFLGCIYFLSTPGMYKNVAAATYQPITNLTSSISIVEAIPPMEVASILQSATDPLILSTGRGNNTSLLTNETATPSTVSAATAEQATRRVVSRQRLLTVPTVTITSESGIADSAIFADQANADVQSAAPRAYITTRQETGTDYTSAETLHAYILAIKEVADKNQYSERYAFLINMAMKSGKKRFFVVDLETGTVIKRGLVAHGQGKSKFTLNKSYSNKPGSGCSSLGIYRVGGAYNGGYGKSFRLIGLEKTNSNAARRAIVLHAMNCIPDEEIDYPICQSEGCPSLSTQFFQELSILIKGEKKPILLWAFDSEKR